MRRILPISLLAVILIISGCANIGNPEGGPTDEDPPVLIKSTPELNQTKVIKSKVVLYFDEIVVLKEINKNFIISPPVEKDPKIAALGKKVSIDINNELVDSTTYTIYLGSSIVDNNQGNPLRDLTFSFSTGGVIDSMELSGILLNAEDLEPLKSTIVGIYKDLTDSAVIKNKPLRIAQTNDDGEFVIKNVAPGKYHIFGLEEMVRNYRYDDPSDKIAFLDSIIIPNYDTIQVTDTLWLDSITVDTITIRDALRYGPYDLTLLSFSEFTPGKNIRKKERSEPWQLLFSFSTKSDSLPRISLQDESHENWFLTEQTVTGDTLIYWITDSTIYKRDTLNVVVDFMKTDSMQVDYWETDTFRMVFRKPKTATSKGKKSKNKPAKKLESLSYSTNFSSTLHINASLQFDFETPLNTFDKEVFHLFKSEDTLKTPLPFEVISNPELIRRYKIKSNFLPGESYTLELDSGIISSIYGLAADKKKSTFSINKEDQYGNLAFLLSGQKKDGIVYLLNKKGIRIREVAFKKDQSKVEFKLLLPDTYYAKLFYDDNMDGIWTSGSYLEKKQAEEVRYFSKPLTIKAYRDYEEDWAPENNKLSDQKPEDLVGLKKD